MVGVARGGAELASGLIEFDGSRVFPPQVVQVGDVIVRLGNQQRHAVLLAIGASFLIGLQGLSELIQADVAHRQVAQRDGDIFRLAPLAEFAVGALVGLERFREAILTVQDIADVQFQARQPHPISVLFKDLPRFLGVGEGLFIPAQIDEGLH